MQIRQRLSQGCPDEAMKTPAVNRAQKPTIVTKPQASQQTINQVLYFGFLLLLIVYLFLRG